MRTKKTKTAAMLGAAGLLAAALLAAPAALRAAMKHGGNMHHGDMHMDMKAGKTVVVKGEILDMSCYMNHEGMGEKHKKCALACLEGGAPAGILTDGGKVYLIVESHKRKAKLAYKQVLELAAERVELTGKKFVRGGLAAISVTKVKKLK